MPYTFLMSRIGQYITQIIAGESYQAYVPATLPPTPPIALESLSPLLEKAAAALAELNQASKSIPNTSLFLYMYVYKEALLSSQIEGTQSSLSDLVLFENNQTPLTSLEDVEEVSNYVKAMRYGLKRLDSGFPLSMRLLREIHAILLSGTRGKLKLPGEFRTTQNWIGGSRPGNALFVPPPVEHLPQCLTNLENFLHTENISVLIKAAMAHLQFESIHPFLDGNGRLGRLLITLLLVNSGLLNEPILYLSLYLKKNRSTYYNLLQEVRTHGTWETWIEFFLTGILETSKQANSTITAINELFQSDIKKINALGRAKPSCLAVFNYLQKLPQISVPSITNALNLSAPAARNAINHLLQAGILKEISGKKRDKVYVYKRYFQLLEYGTEPL